MPPRVSLRPFDARWVPALMDDHKPALLIVGPLPPPAFGVAQATKYMLDSPVLLEEFRLLHLDTSDVEGFAGMGRLNWGNVRLGIQHVWVLGRLLSRERPRVVLLTASRSKYALLRDALFDWLSRRSGAKTIVFLRASSYAETRRRQGLLAYRLLRSMLKHSARVVVLGESLVDMAKKVHPECRIAVIPNGCPPALASERTAQGRASAPTIVSIGRLSREKGLEDALRAIHRASEAVPGLSAILCGSWASDEFRAGMERLVDELQLRNVVSFPGPVSGAEKEAVLESAWALLVTSHSEGHPWVILEAMSTGLPVVATDTGAIGETIQDGVAGFVVPVGDAESLAERLVRILNDDALRNRLSDGALERYLRFFTVEESHRKVAAAVHSVLAEHGEHRNRARRA